MNRTRKHIIIGVLHFVQASICGLLPLVSLIIIVLQPYYPWQTSETVVMLIFCVLGVPISTLSVIGGIYSLKRRRWKLVLVASIIAFFPALLFLLFFISALSNVIDFSDFWDLPFWLVIPFAIAVTNFILIIKAKKYFYNRDITKKSNKNIVSPMQVKRRLVIIAIFQFIEAAICVLFPLISLIIVLLLPWYWRQQRDTVFFAIISIVGVATAILSVKGGINSLKRGKWKLVLTSSIVILLPSILLLLFFIIEISDVITIIQHSSIGIWYIIRSLDFWFVIPVVIAIVDLILVIKAKKYFNTSIKEPREFNSSV